ncbi:transmembrane protein, putative [Bodo saltans]|uniref:Transmembrane protein, putative n=1 Tax=Bodo saltans TaxID=75058 RepID=A0A0S4JHK2_BODSA|nr:transmembrane protein, putative [Bodo saltans]|eukprot:CUG89604.1 transmembrane protein, putative [Bodo saltans]
MGAISDYGSSSSVDNAFITPTDTTKDREAQSRSGSTAHLSVNETTQPAISSGLSQRSIGSSTSPMPREESHYSVRSYATRNLSTTHTHPLVEFCLLYFKGKGEKVDITQNLPEPPLSLLANTRGGSVSTAQNTFTTPLMMDDDGRGGKSPYAKGYSWYSFLFSYKWYLSSASQFFRWLNAAFRHTILVAPRDRNSHYLFYALVLLSFAVNMTSLFVSVYASDSESCNVIIPTASDDCCQCVCNINASWCATVPQSFANASFANGTSVLVPLNQYGNYFSGSNSIEQTLTSKKLNVATVYALSLAFALIQLGMARIRGNWYMLLCVCAVMILQSLRNLYLHFPVSAWSTFVDSADALDVVVLVADVVSVLTAVVATAMLRSLRPAFLTTQFQQFGHLTTHQETLRNYSVMFATVLFDCQTSSLLYIQLAALASSNTEVSSCLTVMLWCDITSNYVGYTYVRFERYWGIVTALLSKAILAVSWIVFSAYVMQMLRSADALDVVVLVADVVSILTAVVATAMLRSLRPAFLTTQFQQFGHLTTHQETLRNYSVMFATVLFDCQTSSLLYIQLAALASSNTEVSSCLTVMLWCDITSNYVGYTYVRFERYWGIVTALLSKAILAVSWIVFSAYVMQCYDMFQSRALFLRVTLVASQYLGVDAADAQAYLLGDCKISPVVSGSRDVVVMFALMAIAFFVRVISIFYAALLTADFGKTIIASLFFDVVAIQQKTGLPLPDAAVDTLDVRKQRT